MAPSFVKHSVVTNTYPKCCLPVGFFIPPRQDQAFNQGGTFIFDGDQTVFAHYDEGTGAHSDIQEVIDYAKGRIKA